MTDVNFTSSENGYEKAIPPQIMSTSPGIGIGGSGFGSFLFRLGSGSGSRPSFVSTACCRRTLLH